MKHIKIILLIIDYLKADNMFTRVKIGRSLLAIGISLNNIKTLGNYGR